MIQFKMSYDIAEIHYYLYEYMKMHHAILCITMQYDVLFKMQCDYFFHVITKMVFGLSKRLEKKVDAMKRK